MRAEPGFDGLKSGRNVAALKTVDTLSAGEEIVSVSFRA